MSKVEIGYHIHAALRQVLKEQQKLLFLEHSSEFLPVIRRIAQFSIELEDWYSGKYHLQDRSAHFLEEAKKIEAAADEISEQVWSYAPLELVPYLERICVRRAELKTEKTFPSLLKPQYDNFRLGLLEQVAGARFLANNSDLGEEVERILVQYLERRFGASIRVVRGGHIYDFDGHRSDQIDIIITLSDSLSFCPADTSEGKYNVIIDQVIAAISVTSRLTADRLAEKWRGLQSIPAFKDKERSFPGLKDHAWPLCYIVGAESDDLEKLKTAWEKIVSETEFKHVPQMVFLLDSGYLMAGTACWPRSKWGQGAAAKLHVGTGLYAGLGLGWLELQIAGRNCVATRKPVEWVQRLSEQLSQLELTELLPFDAQKHRFFIFDSPVHGVLKWGAEEFFPHNRLHLNTMIAGNETLTDASRAIACDKYFGRYQFEPRWFRLDEVYKNGDYCALEEWIKPGDAKTHRTRIAVFDSRDGQEVTDKLGRSLVTCSELEKLNPVLSNDAR
jgi:hypothetical protein